MVRAVALEERATDGGQARQQHLEVVIIPLARLGRRVSCPGHSCTGAATGGSECELGGTAAAERLT